ncbi:MAG: hypothetical protein HFH68_08370 [Lachnospiraceae bacterium]|nr:hypothetical protein [Lachnospiraceae bacterium]
MEIPAKSQEEPAVKKKARELYVEADEDHVTLQFHKKKGDIKRYKGHGDNTQIVKLVYVHEGYTDWEGKRKRLRNAVYFGGLYNGKDNGKLWDEVKEYIGNHYMPEETEKIYFQSDGGAWMKKGIEALGAEFVLDGFHIQKYIRRMARLAGDKKACKKRRKHNQKQYREPHKPCAFFTFKLQANGMVHGRNGQNGTVKGLLEKRRQYAGTCKIPERRKIYRKNRRREIFQCNRNICIREKTKKSKREIHRSITGRHKQPDICKNIF